MTSTHPPDLFSPSFESHHALMSSYATQADLESRYGKRLLVQLTDRPEDQDQEATGEVDAVIVAKAIADASAIIDGHVATRYALPLASTPPLLNELCCTIAVYKLYRYMPEEKIRDEHAAALKSLDGISKGSVSLPDVAGLSPAASPAMDITTTGTGKAFGNGPMDGFI
jgi:phage gp36-like protein